MNDLEHALQKLAVVAMYADPTGSQHSLAERFRTALSALRSDIQSWERTRLSRDSQAG